MATGPGGLKTIAQFLIGLTDPERLAEWNGASSTQRREIMDAFGLTPEQQSVILLGDLALLQGYLDYEYEQGYVTEGGADAPAGQGVSLVVTYRQRPTYQPSPGDEPSPPPPPMKVRRIPTY